MVVMVEVMVFLFIYLLINKAQKGITLISHAELVQLTILHKYNTFK